MAQGEYVQIFANAVYSTTQGFNNGEYYFSVSANPQNAVGTSWVLGQTDTSMAYYFPTGTDTANINQWLQVTTNAPPGPY